MITRARYFACATMLSASLAVLAAPAKREPVAEGFPDWDGVVEKNRITTTVKRRALCPSDLRHKVVVIVVLDANDPKMATTQLPLFASVARFNPMMASGHEASLGSMINMTEVPRKTLVVGSFRGKRDAAAISAALSPKDKAAVTKISPINAYKCPLYFDLAMVGEPANTEGKYPFCYVLNGHDNNPIWKGVVTAASVKDIEKAVKDAAKAIPEWTPMTGVAEATTQKTAMKHIKDGKMEVAKKALLPGLKSKDKASATEAQMMYDAIEQYRSDTVYLITEQVSISPALAVSNMTRLLKLYPNAAKDLAQQQAQLSKVAGAKELSEIIAKYRLWTSEDYKPKNAQEAKKNVQEVVKWKKMLEQLENSKDMKLQGDAMYLNQQLDSLKAILESKMTK